MSGSLSIDPRQADRSSILGVFASSSVINVTNASWLSRWHKRAYLAAPLLRASTRVFVNAQISFRGWDFKGEVSGTANGS